MSAAHGGAGCRPAYKAAIPHNCAYSTAVPQFACPSMPCMHSGHRDGVAGAIALNRSSHRHVERVTHFDPIVIMRPVWRFFVDGSGLWCWEELTGDKTVARRSARTFESYDECVADARRAGYTFEASQQGSPRSMSIRKRD